MDEAPYRNFMRRRETEGHIRFITFSCYRRLPLLRDPVIADLASDSLGHQVDEGRLDLFAWVIMPSHIHLLFRLNQGCTWAQVATAVKSTIARKVISGWRECNFPLLADLITPQGKVRFWQHGGGFDRQVRNLTELTKTVHYIHHNPVEAKLTERPDGWKWSSIHWWMGNREGQIPCDRLPGSSDWDNWAGYF